MDTAQNQSDLRPQRVALVTGSGAARVGNNVARWLAAREFCVAVHYLESRESAESTSDDIIRSGGTAAAFQADVTSEADVDRLVAEVTDHFGRIDLLVCAASRWQHQPLEQVSAADIRAAFDVDVLGTFLCARRAGLVMAQQDSGGCIVNIGDASISQPRSGEAAYYLAKGCIPTMTQMLAVELAARNPAVRVNAILPGSVMAPAGLTDDQLRQRQSETLTQTADDITSLINAISYLINSPFVTGTCLTVDGGRGIQRGTGSG